MSDRLKTAQSLARRIVSCGLNVLIPYRSEARRLKQKTDTLARQVSRLTQESARWKQEKAGHVETIRALRRQCEELEHIAEFLYDRLRQQGGIEPDAAP